jgi:hypothetical protein
MSNDRDRLAAAKKRLADYLDEIDQQTRLRGEKPLREAVAEQARERLLEMTNATEGHA